MVRCLRHWLPVCVVLIIAGICPAFAHEVAIITSREAGPEREVADALLAADTRQKLFLAGSAERGIETARLSDGSLMLALGSAAAEAAIASGRPTLVALVTASEFERLRAGVPQARLSAQLINQPPERHLALIRATVPQAACTGLLLGPESRTAERPFAEAAEGSTPAVIADFAASASTVLPVLERLLGRCGAVLVLPDRVISSPTVARAALLASYRVQRPLFAYSRAWVEAGALAAVFSTPATATRDILEWLDRLESPDKLPPPSLARHFDLAVNARVARTLNLPVPDAETLRMALSDGSLP